ncbi:hypothetical protein LEP1GSC188_3044 [Leptospira weilii serovar Topaz str. LT2116]|uniref:Uncharacterized protein n=3 Tax=Leptospira weilii TaxID=28184 RepID=M3H0Z8_9LEPT|nr:hypothetical protein LEP1GSC036_4072 [Leptospira weilii str. 2006001853]EMF82826.1 hypothetical protein LEP1GSC188_3044 [Leptospira weilii serovar Topaz str. LT2116]EMN46201.1 hypothetical protein LEP1GSC086_3432 [Leptospira weilii str. LNT 1234]EMY15862.1 hypothetical protein LEP1GSC043_1917 [Leptospira weilii str. Ecochallenge]
MKSCKELSSFFMLKRVSIPFEDNFMFVGVSLGVYVSLLFFY